jgi:hypothetical protein
MRRLRISGAICGEGTLQPLHRRFDVALEQGLGELLVDYMVEVCKIPQGHLSYVCITLDDMHKTPKAIGRLQTCDVPMRMSIQVCSDPFLTSADPVDAHLMDGRCMQQWAHRTLFTSRARLLQVPYPC